MKFNVLKILPLMCFVSAANATAAPGEDTVQTITVGDTLASFELVKTPTTDPAKFLWVMKNEVTWDLYDIFLLRLDMVEAEREKDVDIITRPSQPYWLPDEGFGHAGHPALAINYNGAEKFAIWLSGKTGLKFRVPGEDEWEHFCRAGQSNAPTNLDDVAWHDDNSDGMTGAVGSKKANGFSLHDTVGNVSEWVYGRDGKMVIKGGSFWDYPEDVRCDFREVYTSDWNASDPQFPKSAWWMADAPFAGFRLVMDE